MALADDDLGVVKGIKVVFPFFAEGEHVLLLLMGHGK